MISKWAVCPACQPSFRFVILGLTIWEIFFGWSGCRRSRTHVYSEVIATLSTSRRWRILMKNFSCKYKWPSLFSQTGDSLHV